MSTSPVLDDVELLARHHRDRLDPVGAVVAEDRRGDLAWPGRPRSPRCRRCSGCGRRTRACSRRRRPAAGRARGSRRGLAAGALATAASGRRLAVARPSSSHSRWLGVVVVVVVEPPDRRGGLRRRLGQGVEDRREVRRRLSRTRRRARPGRAPARKTARISGTPAASAAARRRQRRRRRARRATMRTRQHDSEVAGPVGLAGECRRRALDEVGQLLVERLAASASRPTATSTAAA